MSDSSPGGSGGSAVKSSSPAGGAHFTYRPEIDGLRALAVLAVVFFHADISFPGGYVGVDVFFVISGYLITSLILKDLRNGKFSIVDFWERRVRRIFPALFVTVCATLLLGSIFIPHDYKVLGQSAIFQSIALANVYFWRTSGYFAGAAEIKPLLHTWSLAVEEQFYFFLPFLLLLVFRTKVVRKERMVLALLLLVSAASFALAVVLLPFKQEAVFFLLPTRAWELLAGSLAALVPFRVVPDRKWLREGCGLIGLAAIIIPYFEYSRHIPFPGLAALPPVLGAVLFILANTPRPDGTPALTSSGRLFAAKPVVFIGLISYSLYLWHWPIIVFGKYWFAGQPVSDWFKAGLIVLMLVAAVLSWRFVETPFRLRKVAASRRTIFTFGLAGTVLMIAAGGALSAGNGFPQRFSPLVVANSNAAGDKPSDKGGRKFGRVEDGVPLKVLLWGDSHAGCVAIALDRICAEQGMGGIFMHRNDLAVTGVAAYAKEHGFSSVVISQYWGTRRIKEGDENYRALAEMITRLDEAGCKVWFLLDFPDIDADGPRVMARAELFGWKDESWKRTVEYHRKRNQGVYKLSEIGLPATFLDLSTPMLDASGKAFVADDNGVALYCDDDHLTNQGTLKLLLPFLKSAFEKDPLVADP